MASKLQLPKESSEEASTFETTASNRDASRDHPDKPIRREQIFEILSNERRRLVLRYLHGYLGDDPIPFRDLVDHVTAWENDIPLELVDSGDRKAVYTALRQTHLPKLDRYGVVEFDRQRGTIRPEENLEYVLFHMKHVPENERFWNRWYLSLAVLCIAAVLLIWSAFGPVGGVPAIAVSIGIATAFATSAIVQTYQTRRRDVQTR